MQSPSTLTRWLLMLVFCLFASAQAGAQHTTSPPYTITPEFAPTFPAESEFEGFVSQSADALAPFQGKSALYHGAQQGGSAEQRNGAYLIYRYRVDFPQVVRLNSLFISGAGFTGSQAALCLMDADHHPIAAIPTFGESSYQCFTLGAGGAQGATFYIEEYDNSPDWRFRDQIKLNYVTEGFSVSPMPESSLPYMAGMNFNGFFGLTCDPAGPFSGKSVYYRGRLAGGSAEVRNGASLVYRFRVDFPKAVRLSSIRVTGAGFNGSSAALRLLDAQRQELAVMKPTGGNAYTSNTLSAGNVEGTMFYIDEFDTSPYWRYRDRIRISYQIGKANLSGVVTLEDCVQSQQPLVFTFHPLDGNTPFTRSVTPGANGAFTLTDLPARPYDVAIKGAKWLQKNARVELLMGSKTDFQTLLNAGDADYDNMVTSLDLDLLIQSFDSEPGMPEWNGDCDFNCDGYVDVLDLDLLIRNFDATGDE